MEERRQELRRLEKEEIAKVYESQMCRDFPKSELKPLSAIFHMWEHGMYDCLGFYEEGQMTAYAFSVTDSQRGYLLLDYLAVCENCRGGGHGSSCLKAMKGFYGNEKGILLECESPQKAETEAEAETCRRRIRFYERSGCRQTKVRSKLFGVDFDILYLPLTEPEADVAGELTWLYRRMLPGQMYDKYVQIIICR